MTPHRCPSRGPDRAAIRLTTSRRTCAGPCEPSRHAVPGGPTGPDVLATLARRLPSRVLDATKSHLVSLCLADECYRPNCQRVRSNYCSTVQHGGRFGGVVGFFRLARVHSTPSAGVRCLSATHPGRLQRSVSIARQEQYYPIIGRGQLPTPEFSRIPRGCLGPSSDEMPEVPVV
jgi:hypothetical protein